ncbi:efflux RND transporter permease subunit [Prosthecobacter vanneervenii]|uniref:Cobalt-zinc-cadmium resistance protein CzcA n=1 Tax=Prosthecobacter vanneervenii TaxID=48466 RepID=A0A7W8DLV3_9BACT|nr:CusA/CzcA family heavy metal efflux RND transporter [Prosthecobacter vanneervenii]MBB5034430.1 cobalt-zinc-cadmium resistance protein CzcA [Prosthecobacter vanneervenii]
MLNFILDFSVRQRALVLLGALGLLIAGLFSLIHLPIDAVPDLTGPQVQVNVAVPALAPEESERAVTRPIEMALSGMPGVLDSRSLTKFGLSQVTIVFEDGTDIFRARQLVTERLTAVMRDLPPGSALSLAPISTGLGEIFYYTLHWKKGAKERPADEREGLMRLWETHEYIVKPHLRVVQGVAEINSNGGHQRQVTVEPMLDKLKAANMTVGELAAIIRGNVENAGGGVINREGEQLTIRSVGRVSTAEEIASLPIKFGAAITPLKVQDVAKVQWGAGFRAGAATMDGDEVVLGTVMMLMGQNARVVCDRVKPRLEELREKLPAGMDVKVVYERSDLVEATVGTVEKNLLEGAVLVIVVLLALLGNWRAALIVALAIPLSFLFAICGMMQGGWSGNLMSLGAVDFGLIIDGAVVMVENIIRRLGIKQHHLGRVLTGEERSREVLAASKQMASPMFFGVLIITIVYLPILTLTGIEGKMFRPMAVTVIFALAGALLLALTLMPAMCSFFLGGNIAEKENWLIAGLNKVFQPMLRAVIRLRWVVVLVSVGFFAFCGWRFTTLGAEFVPKLDEGSIAGMIYRKVGMNLKESLHEDLELGRLVREKFPQVTCIFTRSGTSEVATDPMPPNETDFYIFYTPISEWPKGPGLPSTKAELCEAIEKEALSEHEGQTIEFGQPIETRFNEMMEGTKAELAVRIYGIDFDVLEKLAAQIRDIINSTPGGAAELETNGRTSSVVMQVKREILTKYNVPLAELNHAVSAGLGGEVSGQVVEGNRRRDIVVRLPEDERSKEEVMKSLPLRVGDFGMLSLGDAVDIRIEKTVEPIRHSRTQRRAALLVNVVGGRDMEGFVNEASARIKKEVSFPEGYSFEFGGTFENLQEARARLAVVVPTALLMILMLIFFAFGSIRQTLLVATGIPLALTGGIIALWLRGMPFSITAAVGFIALSGVAVLNGLVLVNYFNELREEGHSVRDAVLTGVATRLRPVMMTALVAALGFVPMALAHGAGAEVQRPLATVVIGGIISSTLLTLLLLPMLYDWIESRAKRKAAAA